MTMICVSQRKDELAVNSLIPKSLGGDQRLTQSLGHAALTRSKYTGNDVCGAACGEGAPPSQHLNTFFPEPFAASQSVLPQLLEGREDSFHTFEEEAYDYCKRYVDHHDASRAVASQAFQGELDCTSKFLRTERSRGHHLNKSFFFE